MQLNDRLHNLVCPLYRMLPLILLVLTVSACGLALKQYGPISLDKAILLWFRDSQDHAKLAGPTWITPFWLSISWLGDTAPRLVAAGLGITVLLWLRRWQRAVFVTGVLLSGISLSTLIKAWVARPRPDLVPHLDQVSSMSFPSGHALNSTLFYLTLALVLAPLLRQRIAQQCLYGFAIISALAIGVSRIALGVHWPSDVMASWIIAYSWLGLWVIVAKQFWPEALKSI
jgi:undecaprenyl-diphosphatase